MFSFTIDGDNIEASYSEVMQCFVADKSFFEDCDIGEIECEGFSLDENEEFSAIEIISFSRRKCYFIPIFEEDESCDGEGECSEEGSESESGDSEYWEGYSAVDDSVYSDGMAGSLSIAEEE